MKKANISAQVHAFSLAQLAEVIGCHPVTACNKINGHAPLKQDEIANLEGLVGSPLIMDAPIIPKRKREKTQAA